MPDPVTPDPDGQTKFCDDFWESWGYDHNPCCDSCHEDVEFGFDLPEPPDGSDGQVCCFVVREFERRQAAAPETDR